MKRQWRKVLSCTYAFYKEGHGCFHSSRIYRVVLECGHKFYRSESNKDVKRMACKDCEHELSLSRVITLGDLDATRS